MKIKVAAAMSALIVLFIFSCSIYAEDNADSGSGDTTDAIAGKAFYRSSEYMYKVSVYVGLSDTSKEDDSTTYDYEYRVDTDVITSVRIYADEDITPDNRNDSETVYANPVKNTATVTITANGYSKRTEIVLPSGSSELVWLKWHTPSYPSQVQVQVQVSGNLAAKIEGTARSSTLTCNVVDLDQNEPPNPSANDRNDSFITSSVPEKADKTTAEWGIYSSYWVPDWVWHAKWVDEGNWEYDYTNYHASK